MGTVSCRPGPAALLAADGDVASGIRREMRPRCPPRAAQHAVGYNLTSPVVHSFRRELW